VGGTQLFAETSAVPGSGISVGSQRNLSNNFIVDGLSANDDAAGLAGMPYGVDAVDQFQVVTSGGQAELGRALGGYVNVVTRSGTNATRGDVYGYFRDDTFNGKNALSGTKLPMSQKQFGGSLGGPVTKDRSFCFANAEQRLLDQTGLSTISDASAAVINARLAAVGCPGQPIVTGIYPNPVHSVNVLGKVDHQFNADPAHPQIASDFHTNTAVVWDEFVESARRVVFRPVTDGKAGPAQVFTGDVSYPVVASTGDAWVVPWTARHQTGRSVIDGRRVPAAGHQ
jgi:hypothetical protein